MIGPVDQLRRECLTMEKLKQFLWGVVFFSAVSLPAFLAPIESQQQQVHHQYRGQ